MVLQVWGEQQGPMWGETAAKQKKGLMNKMSEGGFKEEVQRDSEVIQDDQRASLKVETVEQQSSYEKC